MKIEKLIDQNIDLEGATEQAVQPWVSVWCGPWIVTGTSDIEEAKAFIREFMDAGPSLGDPATMGSTTLTDWTKQS